MTDQPGGFWFTNEGTIEFCEPNHTYHQMKTNTDHLDNLAVETLFQNGFIRVCWDNDELVISFYHPAPDAVFALKAAWEAIVTGYTNILICSKFRPDARLNSASKASTHLKSEIDF